MNEILVLEEEEPISATTQVQESLAELGLTVNVAGSADDAARFPDAEILIAPILPSLPDVLERLPHLRWIHFLSAGVDRIWDMPFDKSRYQMSKSIGVHAAPVSEYVLGAILYALKGFGTFTREQPRRQWRPFWLDECTGKTLGIVGIGTIGAHLARQANALGMTVIGTVATPRPIPYVEVYPTNRIEEVLKHADFLVLLVPLTPQTRRLIDADAMRSMKRGTWLINVARGAVVDETALIKALESGHLGGAVLDVFENEPLHESSPLWEFPNVLITPHVAGSTMQNYMKRALDVFKENYRRYVETGELATPVSIEKGY